MNTAITIRGKAKICYKGIVYVKQKALVEGVVSYECEKRHGAGKGSMECKAKLKVKDEVVVGSIHQYTHAPDEARIEVLSTRWTSREEQKKTIDPMKRNGKSEPR